ncbi:peroxiredoxin [Pseudonocardia yunnanensis]|uniref:Peroxiredoxin n=1 Tax=Pseudonocardia yunnanensis TaxID=58107 RepID=A0ABW4FA46_9PSEU
MSPEVGTEAPDFTLKDQNNQDVTLSSFRGKSAVLLVFYPFAFSPICQGELCSVRDDLSEFQNEKVQILAISVDHPYTLKAWADAQGYKFPLLSDFWPHGELTKTYSVFNDTRGIAVRGTFLVDKEGIVRFSEVNQPSDARNLDGWMKAVSELAA